MAFDKDKIKDVHVFEEMNKRYKTRKEAKEEFDKMHHLSNEVKTESNCLYTKTVHLQNSEQTKRIRLLDEGVIIMGDDVPVMYLKKGTIKDFYNRLEDEYVGIINFAHHNYISYPHILGYWTKEDLILIENEDGRYSLDVNLNLDTENFHVKDWMRVGNPLAVSAEIVGKLDFDASEELEVDVWGRVDITDFAIVGEPGNVGSGGLQLKNKGVENMADFKKWFDQKAETLLNKKTDESKQETKTEAETELNLEDVEKIKLQLEEGHKAIELANQLEEALTAERKAHAETKEKLKQAEEKVVTHTNDVLAELKKLAVATVSEEKEKEKAEKLKHDQKEELKFERAGDGIGGI